MVPEGVFAQLHLQVEHRLVGHEGFAILVRDLMQVSKLVDFPNRPISPVLAKFGNEKAHLATLGVTHAGERVALVEAETVEAEIVDNGQKRAALFRPLGGQNLLGAVASSTDGILVLKTNSMTRVATWVKVFVRCFRRVPQLLCSFPAAQSGKRNSQKIIYKTSYPSSGPPY